jgi:putative tryptophan/tyrosine transport system substrate-binding protein
MKRREFVTLLGGAAAWPLVAHGQQPALPAIGYLDSARTDQSAPTTRAFLRGMSEAGFDAGRNVAIDYRTADGQYDRLPGLAAELVRRNVAAIYAVGGGVVVQAAKAATETIPIVFSYGGDPVKDGLIASLNRPGRNVTGVTFFSNVLIAKRVGLLHDLLPNVTAFAVLMNPNNANYEQDLNEIVEAGRSLGLKLDIHRATNESEIDAAFLALAQSRAAALFVTADAYFFSRRTQITTLATRHGIPTDYSLRDYAEVGGLMSYGTDLADANRQAGDYVGRILKGEKPGNLPVVQPTKFELIINLTTAKALGLIVPPTLLAIADEVIE